MSNQTVIIYSEEDYKRWASKPRTPGKMKIKIKTLKLRRRLQRRLLLAAARKLTPNLFIEVPLGVECLEFVQYAVGFVEGSKLNLVTVTLTLLKIRDPLLSPHLDIVVERGPVLVISYRGANSCPSPVEISFGPG